MGSLLQAHPGIPECVVLPPVISLQGQRYLSQTGSRLVIPGKSFIRVLRYRAQGDSRMASQRVDNGCQGVAFDGGQGEREFGSSSTSVGGRNRFHGPARLFNPCSHLIGAHGFSIDFEHQERFDWHRSVHLSPHRDRRRMLDRDISNSHSLICRFPQAAKTAGACPPST